VQEEKRAPPTRQRLAAAANPFALLGDGEDGDADDDEEMAEAVLGCQLGK